MQWRHVRDEWGLLACLIRQARFRRGCWLLASMLAARHGRLRQIDLYSYALFRSAVAPHRETTHRKTTCQPPGRAHTGLLPPLRPCGPQSRPLITVHAHTSHQVDRTLSLASVACVSSVACLRNLREGEPCGYPLQVTAAAFIEAQCYNPPAEIPLNDSSFVRL